MIKGQKTACKMSTIGLANILINIHALLKKSLHYYVLIL